MAGFLSKLAVATLLGAALFSAGPAQARECVTGWIAHVDRQNDTITLGSGEILLVSADINLEDLSEGIQVKLLVMRTSEGIKAVDIAPAVPPAGTARPAGRV